MKSLDRRSLILRFPALLTVSSGGCLGGPPPASTDRPVESISVRTIGPTRTDGSEVEVTVEEASLDELEQELRRAISNRTDCIVGEIPIQSYNSGLLVTTRTVVESLDNADVEFPSSSFEHLKEVTPRSIRGAPSSESPATADERPVYIKAILQEGDEERVVPRTSGSC